MPVSKGRVKNKKTKKGFVAARTEAYQSGLYFIKTANKVIERYNNDINVKLFQTEFKPGFPEDQKKRLLSLRKPIPIAICRTEVMVKEVNELLRKTRSTESIAKRVCDEIGNLVSQYKDEMASSVFPLIAEYDSIIEELLDAIELNKRTKEVV